MYECISVWLYIVLFLHQTTTIRSTTKNLQSCISYYSYIKPQPRIFLTALNSVVYRTIPTSNHNHSSCFPRKIFVVYRTIPTSNHNPISSITIVLDVVYRTIPTSNHNFQSLWKYFEQVVYRTIPTSNHNPISTLYIALQVVYRTIPTSNHNCNNPVLVNTSLYIVLFLHQTTTCCCCWSF